MCDYRKKRDLFGRPFVFAQSNIADMLSSAAVLMMGEGDEMKPLVIIRELEVVYTNRKQLKEDFIIHPEDDMYNIKDQ